MTELLTRDGHVAAPSRPVARLERISGPVVVARGIPAARLFDVVGVGEANLLGEIIRIDGDTAVIQVFEDTTGLRAGEPVVGTNAPLQVELGPGLLGSIVDGTQRPLGVLSKGGTEAFISPGADPPRLDRSAVWEFVPAVAVGDTVHPGQVVGTVAEGPALIHRILVPELVSGVVTAVSPGPATVTDTVVEVAGTPIRLAHRWPVRRPRPVGRRLPLSEPLVTNQRVLDMLFPVARGGSAVVPGGFGTGKTVLEQSLAKYAQSDVVVYVGCGERGNELAEVLEDFPRLIDPRTGASLMQRTVLVANTSNMPVAAREASIYTGVTIAEYYRDQGYDVSMMSDSTSRWGEALREVSSRLEEVPAEDGYPAYLGTRLAGFYERAGRVTCLGPDERQGSVTLVGAVSPAGGDFSEPMTQTSLRLTGCFWALDTRLARQRHFPSINWNRSYSQYDLGQWFDANVSTDWTQLRTWALGLLQQESALQEVVNLLGLESLAAEQRVVLRTGRLLREDFLQQDSFDDADALCPPAKQVAMLRAIHVADAAMRDALARGVEVQRLETAPALAGLAPMKRWPVAEVPERVVRLSEHITNELKEMS